MMPRMRFVIFFVLLMVTSSTVLSASAQDIDSLKQEFEQLYDAGRHEKAIDVAKQVLELSSQDAETAIYYATKIGDCYYEIREYYNALDYYQQAQERYSQTEKQKSAEYAELLSKIGDCYYISVEHYNMLREKGLNMFGNQSVNNVLKTDPLPTIDFTNLLHVDYDKAIDYYSQARAVYESLGEKERRNVAKMCSNIALCHKAKYDDKNAIEKYIEANGIYESIGEGDSQEVVDNLLEIGDCYYKLEKPDSSLLYLSRAERIFVRRGNDGSDHYITLLKRMGSFYSMAEKYDDLIATYTKIKNAYIKRGEQESEEYLETLSRLADVYFLKLDFEKTREEYFDILKLCKGKEYAKNVEINANYTIGLSYSLQQNFVEPARCGEVKNWYNNNTSQ